MSNFKIQFLNFFLPVSNGKKITQLAHFMSMWLRRTHLNFNMFG